jgi:hypothetical protein
MEEARTPETSVDIQLRTRQYIPEDSELHTRLRENLKSHMGVMAANTLAPLLGKSKGNHCFNLKKKISGWDKSVGPTVLRRPYATHTI